MPEEKEKRFLKVMREKFKEEPTDKHSTFYTLGGWRQSKRKTDFMETSKKIEERRGFPSLNEDIGVPLGQRVLMPYRLSHTDIMVEPDDLNVINNAAMQQSWDDIRRTVLVGLDVAHSVLEKRLGKEVTPETINWYMETYNHTIPGGAVIQEHMAECDPAVTGDAYVKIFTGDDELADEVDKRFLIDINDKFPDDQAKQLKDAIGKSLWQVIRVPTITGRAMDGGTVSRWAAMQSSMAFISSYKLAAGEAAISDFAYASKHAAVIGMGEAMPLRRVRGPNEPGGIPFGNIADMSQSLRVYPDDPVRATLEAIALGAVICDQIYLGQYMSGGIGFTQYASATYTDNILEEYCYWAVDYVKEKYGGLAKIKPTMEEIEKITVDVADYTLGQYETYPSVMEAHFGGSQRAAVVSATCGVAVGMATGNADAGVNAWYLSQLLHKEEAGRLGFYGYDLQDQCGSANSASYRSDEGIPFELRGPNYPNYAMNVGHMSAYTGIAAAPHAARGDAWCLNPLIKVAFADDALSFDFANITKEYGRGGLREFKPEGERTGTIAP